MAYSRNSYEYETSPRKLKPDYNSPKQDKKKKNSTVNKKKQKVAKKEEKLRIRKFKCIAYLIIAFMIMFAMGFQNSQINEQFSKLKVSEKQLATIQKENEQLRINIENNLNLSSLEQMAIEQLGMQKATTSQTKYVRLPKRDYVEVASEKIIMDSDQNWFERIINFIQNIVK